MEKSRITEMVNFLLNFNKYTKMELAGELDISRPTLDSRLIGKSEWKKLEVKFINKAYDWDSLQLVQN